MCCLLNIFTPGQRSDGTQANKCACVRACPCMRACELACVQACMRASLKKKALNKTMPVGPTMPQLCSNSAPSPLQN